MDDKLLLALAHQADGPSFTAERVAIHSGAIRNNNQRVADAALLRVGIDCLTETFDTFRAHHVHD